MNRKDYRIRKVANDYRRDLKRRGILISVAQAYKEAAAIQKIFAAVGPMNPRQRSKVFRMMMIALEP